MYYDCSPSHRSMLLFSTVLIWWSSHTILNSGNISALLLCPRLLDQQKLTRAQIGPVEFGGKIMPYEEKSTRCVMIILCQWDFTEQVQKLVKCLLYTTNNWRKKTYSVYVLYTGCNQRVNASFELTSPFRIKTQTLAVFG
jgi:hypothetical protein